MEREDKKGIFFGVIGVLTLIVAIIGASLAYFSINARSDQDAVTVEAANLKVVFTMGDTVTADNLIPSSQQIALKTLTRALDPANEAENYTTCVDDNGYTTCAYYDFTLTNNSTNPMDLYISLIPTELGENEIPFKNLKFSLYERTDVTNPWDNGTLLNTVTDETSYTKFNLLGKNTETGTDKVYNIPNNGSTGNERKLRLFVWLNDTDASDGEYNYQDEEQGAIFKGTISVDVAGSGKVTGTAE